VYVRSPTVTSPVTRHTKKHWRGFGPPLLGQAGNSPPCTNTQERNGGPVIEFETGRDDITKDVMVLNMAAMMVFYNAFQLQSPLRTKSRQMGGNLQKNKRILITS
jgi:hypothetical protein